MALAVLVCFGSTCSLKAGAATVAPDSSLKLQFNFDQDFSDGRVVDVTGNGHDGWRFCPTNWITATNGVFGSVGGAWHTNATISDAQGTYAISQYIGVTNLTGIDYLTNGTISLWAQFGQGSDSSTVLLDAGYSAVYATYPELATNSWSLRRDYRPYLSFLVFDSSPAGRTLLEWPTDVVQSGGSNPDLSTTNYHLYSLTFSCTDNRAIAYYDGQPVMTNSIDLPWLRIYGQTPWLAIGTWAHDGTPQWGDDLYPHSGFFDGRMDDLRIYDRALSAGEVQNLYAGVGVAVSLRIERAAAESVRLLWPSQLGASYQVETSTNPAPAGSWLPFGGPVPGNGTTNNVLDSAIGQSALFYRVRVLP